jgi:hypothetical protein
MKLIDSISWPFVVVICLTLGLAPFTPEPHIWEKLNLLFSGELNQGIDVFDLLMHGLPWVILVAKVLRLLTQTKSS